MQTSHLAHSALSRELLSQCFYTANSKHTEASNLQLINAMLVIIACIILKPGLGEAKIITFFSIATL